MAAVSCVPDTYVVVRADPSHRTSETAVYEVGAVHGQGEGQASRRRAVGDQAYSGGIRGRRIDGERLGVRLSRAGIEHCHRNGPRCCYVWGRDGSRQLCGRHVVWWCGPTPSHRTSERPSTKLVPFTVRVKAGLSRDPCWWGLC